MHLRSRGFREIEASWHCRGLVFQYVAFIFTVFVTHPICQAQSSQIPVLVPHKMVHGDFADWPKITQDVGFIDERSIPAGGLGKDQLLVVEDGVQQSDVKLQETAKAASICLLVDQSGSMKKNGQVLLAAARQIIAAANPTDEFAIVAFDKDVYLEQDFTTDARKLDVGLQRVGFGGPSRLFDAVWVSVDQLAARGPERRKILVILSDGDDNYSHIQFDDLLRKLHYPGAPLIDSLSPWAAQSPDLHHLQAISEETGGLLFMPERPSSLNNTAAEISRDIHSRYSLEYTSTHSQKDGKLHKVEIRVTPGATAAKVKPYFRREYYAPSP